MKTVALFNNKGGVGKTTLTFHLAHMLSRLGYRILAVDIDPQANLTSAFLSEADVENLWSTDADTILSAVKPILDGVGDIRPITPIEIAPRLHLIAGDLGLSRFEDKLSDSWARGFAGDQAALRTTSAFYRVIQAASEKVSADITLIDVGPNLGAINRSALLSSDYLLIPLAADLFSLQGLKNLGPTLREWKENWIRARSFVEDKVNFQLPRGEMRPIGYVVLQHAVRLDRPVKAFGNWLRRIPAEYRRSVLGTAEPPSWPPQDDTECLATLRNYRSLMPMAQDARKPMFDLRPADGAIGSHAQLVQTCFGEFHSLSQQLLIRCGVKIDSH